MLSLAVFVFFAVFMLFGREEGIRISVYREASLSGSDALEASYAASLRLVNQGAGAIY